MKEEIEYKIVACGGGHYEWDAEYIYHRKALLLEKFDLLFPIE